MTLSRPLALLAFVALLAAPLRASTAENALPGPLAEVGFDQRLGETLPFDLPLRDANGREVTLAELADGRPVLLSFVYYECPMLCGMVVDGVARSLKPLELDPGSDFEIVFVSFDSTEGPAEARASRDRALGALRPRGHRRRLALPHRRGRVGRRPHRGGRLPLRLGGGDR